MTKTAEEQREQNTVTLDSRGVINVVLRGKQTAESVRQMGHQLDTQIKARRAQGKRALVMIDLRGLKLSDTTVESRIEAKKMASNSLRADNTAILTAGGIKSIVFYITQIGGDAGTRIFSNERRAQAWLFGGVTPTSRRSAASLVGGLIIMFIAILALVGWQQYNPYLYAWLPDLPPMNPRAAVGLLVAGFGLCCYWLGKMRWLKIAGIFGVAIGILALLPIHADHYLYYGDRVRAAGPRAELADSAALCFIVLGLAPFTIAIKKWYRRPLQYLIAVILFGVGLFNIFGQLYARDFVYSISNTFVMPFNLAVGFVIAATVLVILVLYRKMGSTGIGQIGRVGGLFVVVLLFVQAATYGAWAQTIGRNRETTDQAFQTRIDEVQVALDQRLQAYSSTLSGFKGFFAASDYVDQQEFEAYDQSLDVAQRYPGLRAISFITKVETKDLPAFVAKHKADKSLHPGGNPTFAITNLAPGNDHYIVTYVADSNTVGGNDLASQPTRLRTFVRAEKSHAAVSSGTIQFAATATTPAKSGFFLTIPVGNKTSDTTYGFVNAVFEYDTFFAKAFTETSLQNIKLRIVDAQDRSSIYTTGILNTSKGTLVDASDLPVADRTWKLEFTAPRDFGLNYAQTALPGLIIVGGQLFSLLLIVIFIVLLRSRRQGYALAERITEDLQTERNLAVASDQKSTAILSSIGDAVFAIGTEGEILLFNPAAQQISGLTEQEVLGKPYDQMLQFVFEKDGKPNTKFVREALSGKLASMANHTILIRKDGKRVPVADSAAPIRDAHGKIQGAIIVFRDVSKEYELDKAKTEFVSLASHQLRTPLSAINWYAEMLLGGDAGKLNKDQHEYIKEIFEGNQRMVELVNSLLDVSRLELGKLPNTPAPIDVSDLIESLHKELQTSIKQKQLKYSQSITAVPPVTADPKQLRMIVQNIMSNAVKYTPDKGEVTVTLRKATPDDLHTAGLKGDDPHMLFSVKDTGYGIPKEAQGHIFAKMYRADNVRSMDVEGTGLGLYIVREVVRKMGGRVWFDSLESIGTTFYVVLPLKGKHKHDVLQ